MIEFFKRSLSNENIVDLEEMETRIRQEMARRYQSQVDNVTKYELQTIRKEIITLHILRHGIVDLLIGNTTQRKLQAQAPLAQCKLCIAQLNMYGQAKNLPESN